MNLGIVVPCYKEEAVLNETATRMLNLLDRLIKKQKISKRSKIYFVDDGSIDGTWSIIKKLAETKTSIAGIKLTRNMGHQNALLAGLFTAEGDALVSVDADLQDDINIIEDMVDEHIKGNDLVYGVRKKRETDTVLKRLSAEAFYKIMGFLGVELIFNHADFRLMSRRAIESLKEFKEINLFLRGLVRLLGYQYSLVYYDRAKRYAGETKYPLRRMLSFAIDGITSFSVVPLRIITVIGLMIFLAAFVMSCWVLYVKYLHHSAVPGWASTVLPIYFIGGLQIFCIGVIGEYLGKIYIETKRRPRYIIEKII